MKTKWDVAAIRKEMARLDKKTGLKGSERPISFNNAKATLGSYSSGSGGYFKFSNYYFQDPEWPDEEALDTIRHEYAHYMDHQLNGMMGHGASWKKCCIEVGANPLRCYDKERAHNYQRKHQEEDQLSSKLDTYRIGDRILHPRFGTGTIVEISGEAVKKTVVVEFNEGKDPGRKKLALSWVEENCSRYKQGP